MKMMKKPKSLSDLQRLTLDYGRIYWEANNTHSLISRLYFTGHPEKARALEELQRLVIREARAHYEEEREKILADRAARAAQPWVEEQIGQPE